MSAITGLRVRGGAHAEGLERARRWRVENKPYFDALYGTEDTRTCTSCGGTGLRRVPGRRVAKDAAGD